MNRFPVIFHSTGTDNNFEKIKIPVHLYRNFLIKKKKIHLFQSFLSNFCQFLPSVSGSTSLLKYVPYLPVLRYFNFFKIISTGTSSAGRALAMMSCIKNNYYKNKFFSIFAEETFLSLTTYYIL